MTIDHDPSYTKHITSSTNNNNNNTNRKEDEEETEIKRNTNNRFVSSLTGNNNQITKYKREQTQFNQKPTQISTEPAALQNESFCCNEFIDKNGTITNNRGNCKKHPSSNNNTNKPSAFNCDTTDKKSHVERETDSIFVQTESWRTAKSYTDAIKNRRDSTLLGKF